MIVVIVGAIDVYIYPGHDRNQQYFIVYLHDQSGIRHREAIYK